MTRVCVVGATGNVGGDLIRLLLRHSKVEISHLCAIVEKADMPLSTYFPDLRKRCELPVRAVDVGNLDKTLKEVADASDVIFLALPHTASMKYAGPLLDAGKVVLDLGADFRFRSVEAYEATYGLKHEAPELTRAAVYGIPELYRSAIRAARLIGVAGCYPTSVILPLAPILREGGVNTDWIVADSKSGISGAGSTPSAVTHYVNVNEAMRAYKVADHRHAPEIEEVLSDRAGRDIRLTFVPHLTPMDRGIHSTIYLGVEDGFTEAEARRRLEQAYEKEYFVRVMPPGNYPSTKDVAFTNFCNIGYKLDARNKRLVLCSVIDNLIKGAAGQAVQCMNVIQGYDETDGLV